MRYIELANTQIVEVDKITRINKRDGLGEGGSIEVYLIGDYFCLCYLSSKELEDDYQRLKGKLIPKTNVVILKSSKS